MSVHNFNTFRPCNTNSTNTLDEPVGVNFIQGKSISNTRKDIACRVCGVYDFSRCVQPNELIIYSYTSCERLLSNVFTNLQVTVESKTRAPFAMSKQVLPGPV